MPKKKKRRKKSFIGLATELQPCLKMSHFVSKIYVYFVYKTEF